MELFEQQAEAFSQRIEQEILEGRLNFPTSLDVSMRIRKLAADPKASLDDIAQVVQAEPVLSAKTVRMANAVMMNPYGTPITNVKDAVSRIGLSTLRCLAFAVSFEQLAQDHRSRNLRLVASGLWMHSVNVACWASAIARELKVSQPDTALFAGMLVDIGQFFLLARATDYPAMESNIDRFAEFVNTWHQPVGRAILEALSLPDSIVDAFRYEDPYGGSWPPKDLADVLFIAAMASETPNPFDNLLGIHRPSLLESGIPGVDTDTMADLLASAESHRRALLSTVCG
jgi:HD-like signal output (HDOD) protein